MPAPYTVTNPVPLDEAEGWLISFATTLLLPVNEEATRERLLTSRKAWNAERTWGVHDRGRWVATLHTQTRSVSLPGVAGRTIDIDADAVTAVTVAATHRRRGLLRSMMTKSLEAAKDRGDAFSILIAAEWPIYGRYGFAPATLMANLELEPRRARPLLPPADPDRIRNVDAEEVMKLGPTIFAAAARERAGQVDRRDPWWARRLGFDGWPGPESKPNWVVHEGPHGPDGLLGWKTTHDFDLTGPLAEIRVEDFVTGSPEAYAGLWSYLCGIDAVERVSLSERMVDEPIRWVLHDARALSQTHTGDMLWLRLLDVSAALAARRYAEPGRLVLDVVDEQTGGFGAGRVVLEADGDAVTCVPTREEPDLRLDQRVLASIYLGGHRLPTFAVMGLVDELTDGALQRCDRMFATGLAPVTQTYF